MRFTFCLLIRRAWHALIETAGAFIVQTGYTCRSRITIFALTAIFAAPVLLAAQNYPGFDSARIAAIARMLPADPAGFGPPCSDRAAWIAVAADFHDDVAQAEKFIAAPLPAWNEDAYQLYWKTGDRRTGEAMMRARDGQLSPLVLAECSEWKGRYLPRIEEELDAISSQESWVEPAHTRYAVDLNSSTLAHTVAEALYLLGAQLPPDTRQRAMAGLEQHVFAPMRRSFHGLHPDSWLHAPSNWNAVCLDGAAGAALTILPDRDDRALFAAAAEHFSPHYLDSFKDSGYDEEGIGYWVYGFSHFLDLREQLWLSTGGKIDLFDKAKARRAALFGFQFAMLPGVYASFADAHFGSTPDSGLLADVNRIFGLGMAGAIEPQRVSVFDRELPVSVLAAFPLKSQVSDAGRAGGAKLIGTRTWYADAGILVDRPAPGGHLAITIKAGGNGGHSHNDIGSFSIGLGAMQPLGDPGGPSFYTATTFSPQRLDARLLNSYGHPVPEVDGRQQLDATKVTSVPILSTKFMPQQDSISMDITAAYDDANVRKLVRTMHFSRRGEGAIIIEDRFETAGPAEIVESLPTHGVCRQLSPEKLEFDYQGARLEVTITAPAPITFTQEKIDDYGTAFTRVGAHLRLAHSGSVVMRIRPLAAD
jgi:hypothetical protein